MELGTLVFIVSAAAFVCVSILAFMVLMPRLSERAALRRRIAIVSGTISASEASSAREGNRRKQDIQSRLKEIEQKKTKETWSAKFRSQLRQAGLTISLRTFFIICSGVGIVAAVAYLILGYPAIGVVPVAVAVGFGIPKFIVGWLGRRRVKAFTKEFANAVDIIVRGIRSGLPVGECLNIIATEAPEPVGGVFRQVVESQKLGLGLDRALQRALEQMSTAELKFFAIVLAIQAQTGGNLADTLQNLSNILRERKKMQDKVKALSSEARASAMIIGSLPFLMTGLLWLISPDYIGPLFTEDLGQIMVGGGLAWMSIGVLIMRQMINFDI